MSTVTYDDLMSKDHSRMDSRTDLRDGLIYEKGDDSPDWLWVRTAPELAPSPDGILYVAPDDYSPVMLCESTKRRLRELLG